MTGITALLEVLAAAGVRHIFGNPGTTELPLNDALAADPRFSYILGLHEIPVTAMADGYAMASGGLGVACVHITCGVGNAMGMLYNAHCAGTPLLLLAGQQDRRLAFGHPVLSGDLLGVVRPWTKWSAEVQRVEDIPNAVRRAIQAARTPPTGPVFLALPLDLQTEVATELDVRPPSIPGRLRPPVDDLHRAAELLARARSPAVLAGSRVAESDAGEELAALAERLGAPVYSECATSHGRLPMSSAHPLYAGPLPLWSPDVHALLEPHDLIFVAGMNLLRLYIWREPERPIPSGTKIIHADSNAREIGKNFPVDVGLPGDLKIALAEVCEQVARRQGGDIPREVAQRAEGLARRRGKEQSQLRRTIADERSRRPMTAFALMDAIARALPPNATVVDEAVTTSQFVLERLGALRDPLSYFGHRGWALGWGIGCALGVRVARPERPVLGLVGDGAALYGIQGLWTAAHHRIPVAFIIANNAQYRILKDCADKLPLPEMARGNFLGMDLVGPEIDFVGLSRSLGVSAHRVADPDELYERLRKSWDRSEPILFDVPIER